MNNIFHGPATFNTYKQQYGIACVVLGGDILLENNFIANNRHSDVNGSFERGDYSSQQAGWRKWDAVNNDEKYQNWGTLFYGNNLTSPYHVFASISGYGTVYDDQNPYHNYADYLSTNSESFLAQCVNQQTKNTDNNSVVYGSWSSQDIDDQYISYDYNPDVNEDFAHWFLIDQGADVYFPRILRDLNGVTHFLGDAPDVGAYESGGASGTPMKTFHQYTANAAGEKIVYVTETGDGDKSGDDWDNAFDGSKGIQSAIIAAKRGGARTLWIAQGDYEIRGRELLYTQQNKGFIGGVWSGVTLDRQVCNIYGGFTGDEDASGERPTFTYGGTGVTLAGTNLSGMTNLIGRREYAMNKDSRILWMYPGYPQYGFAFPGFETFPFQPDFQNLTNGDEPSFRSPTLPSQGVRVVAQVENFEAIVDGFDISNGFIATQKLETDPGYGDDLVSYQNLGNGGAGAYINGGTIKNTRIHDNYDAVANFRNTLTCGGGVFLAIYSHAQSCVITDNISETTGGGSLVNPGAWLQDSFVADNIAFEDGGGVYTGATHADKVAYITNTVVVRNEVLGIKVKEANYGDAFTTESALSGGTGGGMHINDNVEVYNCTVVGNKVKGTEGAGIMMTGGHVFNTAVINNLNGSGSLTNEFKISNVDTYVSDSNLEDNVSNCVSTPNGSSSVDLKDYFKNAANNDFSLISTSPLVRAGEEIADGEVVVTLGAGGTFKFTRYPPWQDIIGVSRTAGRWDAGAYTFPQSTYTVTYSAPDSTGGTVPTDSTLYFAGERVNVAGNSGNLVKGELRFDGWQPRTALGLSNPAMNLLCPPRM